MSAAPSVSSAAEYRRTPPNVGRRRAECGFVAALIMLPSLRTPPDSSVARCAELSLRRESDLYADVILPNDIAARGLARPPHRCARCNRGLIRPKIGRA